jgi:hypothetical protein
VTVWHIKRPKKRQWVFAKREWLRPFRRECYSHWSSSPLCAPRPLPHERKGATEQRSPHLVRNAPTRRERVANPVDAEAQRAGAYKFASVASATCGSGRVWATAACLKEDAPCCEVSLRDVQTRRPDGKTPPLSATRRGGEWSTRGQGWCNGATPVEVERAKQRIARRLHG